MFSPGTFTASRPCDRKLCDNVGSRSKLFARESIAEPGQDRSAKGRIRRGEHRAHEYISDMLIALTRATPSKRFFCARTLEITPLHQWHLHENTQRRSLRGRPTSNFTSKSVAAIISCRFARTARRCELTDSSPG